ncbi:hypothetical protein DPMN_075567 [Dreissena polymorpha]|uniref:Uncharacterized protein n=1 Tax=Dreissena polymorpha TaxID=45954 RepID=A0A9D3YLY2_DREPO|nr:hypothetical protein DPMN_075567 [Dreissena polymorpha]
MARQRPTRGAPGLVMGPCIVEIDRIVIRDVQYQFEVNRCRNEVKVKDKFGWAWSMSVGRPRYPFIHFSGEEKMWDKCLAQGKSSGQGGIRTRNLSIPTPASYH